MRPSIPLLFTTIIILTIISANTYATISISLTNNSEGIGYHSNITVKANEEFNITFIPDIPPADSPIDNIDIHLIDHTNLHNINITWNSTTPEWKHTTSNYTNDHYQRGTKTYNEATDQYDDSGAPAVRKDDNLTITFIMPPSPTKSYFNLTGYYNWMNVSPSDSGTKVPFEPKKDSTNYFYFDIDVNLTTPTILSIAAYNVTGKSNPYLDTTVMAKKGLNTTFDMKLNRKYRFDINITTDSDWTVASDDMIYLEGLNNSWTIANETDIWISNSTTNWTGGNFSNGNVSYKSSSGGFIKANTNLTFHFIVNSTSPLPDAQGITVINNTGVSDIDYSTYNLPYPELLVELITPPDNTMAGQNRTIIVNASCLCKESDCGTISATVRYNGSSPNADTEVSTVSGTKPTFLQSGANPKTCSDVNESQYCNISFTLNMSGDLHDTYEIDVNFSAESTQDNHTDDSTVEIGIIILISLGFDNINFGIQDPASGIVTGTDNSIGYNITVDSESNNVKNLWIKSTNLTHNDNEIDSEGLIYHIPVEHSMWSLSDTTPPVPSVYNLSDSYQRINKDMHIIPSGTNETLYFWLNVIEGIMAGGYSGTLSIMANESW